MNESRLGVIETKFADIIWRSAPLKTTELVKLAEAELGWKRTTTYTVLKRLTERGIFSVLDGTVSIIISKEEFFSKRVWEYPPKIKIKFRKCSHTYCACYFQKRQAEINLIFRKWVLICYACY